MEACIKERKEERSIMRKEDLTVPAILAEAVEIMTGLLYIGMQIYYGVVNHVPPYRFICNIVGLILVYVGLTILSNHPEHVNRLSPQMCVGKIRKYTLRMLRLIKLVFVIGLMVPCVGDVIGIELKDAYSLIVIFAIILIAAFYEYKILLVIRNERNNKK